MRKSIFISVIMMALLISCNQQNNESTNKNGEQLSPEIVNNPATASGIDQNVKTPKFEFEDTNFDFGSIKSGAEVTHIYTFKNIGDADLIISQAKGSCGCTEPEYSKDPISPGKTGEIKVTFKSEGMSGQIAKTVTLLANTVPNTKVLTISGEVTK